MTDANKESADYTFPPRKAAPKQGLSIWSIKPRWLRTVVAWPALLLTALGLIVAGLVIAFYDGGNAAWRSGAATFKQVADAWGEIRVAAWAAMTGKDEPQ